MVTRSAAKEKEGLEVVQKFVSHSKQVVRIARRFGWQPGARYTNLRDVRSFDRLGFLDIDWKNYSFKRHLAAARETRPKLTVARDITDRRLVARILDEAEALQEFAETILVVPKSRSLAPDLDSLIPDHFLLGYSVPTKYGKCSIPLSAFTRPVHLLGGRPDVQRRLASRLDVVSLDCNRFTLDATFGDFFDGDKFRPHPAGGYETCIRESLRNMNKIWRDYERGRNEHDRQAGVPPPNV